MTDVYGRFSSLVPTGTPDALFRELEDVIDRLVGVKLFTCSRFDLKAGKAERIYTNNAEAYPLTGLKDIVPNRWTRIVLDNRRPFLATDIEGVRHVDGRAKSQGFYLFMVRKNVPHAFNIGGQERAAIIKNNSGPSIWNDVFEASQRI
ncbi:MAG: hypothetical protein AAGC96_16725, partial [Pseudomonadota bacterium]